MEKRTAHEKEKYQPSYDTTVLTEVMWGSVAVCAEQPRFAHQPCL